MAILRLSARIWTVLLGIALVLVVGGLAARSLLPLFNRANTPTVVAIVPAPGTGDVSLRADLRLRFSDTMNRSSVERALRVEPPISGRFRWDSEQREVTLIPDTALTADITYTLRLEPSAVGQLFTPLAEPFVASFHTAPAPVVVAALPGNTDVSADSPIAIVFSRPMVARDALHRPAIIPELRFEPVLEGEARWIDQTTLLYAPTQPLPLATTVRGFIDAALTDLNGTPLGQPFDWSFATHAPTLLRNAPAPGSRAVGPQQPLVLEFSQQIAVEEIERGLVLTPPTTGSLTSVISGTTQVVTFTADGGWQPETTYTVDIAALRPARGDRPLAPNRWSFTTAPPLALVGRFPGQGQILPDGQAVRLIFASAVYTSTLLNGLRLEPDAGPLRVIGSGAEVRIQADLRASTVYTLTLDQSITDQNGVALDRVYRLNFTTAPAPPELVLPDVAGRFFSLPTDQLATLNVGRTNLSALDLSLYQLDEATLLRVFGFTTFNWSDFQPERYNLPQLRSWRVNLDADPPGQSVTSPLPISAQEPPAPLLPGAYYLRIRSAEGPAADLVLLVSRANLSLVTGTRQSLVWASNATGAPLVDLPLALYAGSSAIGRGRTDANGLWIVDRPPSSGPYLVLADSSQPVTDEGAGAIASSDWTIPGANAVGAERDEYRIALATDQTLYPSNGRILVGGFVRAIENGQIAAPVLNTILDLQLRRAGTTDIITRTSVRLDRSGVVSSSLQLAKIPPGNYLLRAAVGTAMRDIPLQIAPAAQPPFDVALLPSDANNAVVQALTLTGDPLGSARVRWRIAGVPVPEPAQISLPDGMIIGDDEQTPGATIDQQGDATTDTNGRATIPLPTSAITQTTQLRITAEVSESGGLISTASLTRLVPGSDLVIGIRPEASAFVAPSAPSVELLAFQRDGMPAGVTSLQVDVVRRTWTLSPNETRVQRRTLETDTQGRATLTLALQAGGEYRLIVTGRDAAGKVARTARSLWVVPPVGAGPFDGWRVPSGGLLLLPDQPSYPPGATANLLVGLTQPEARLLVTVERGGVLTATLRTLRSSELLAVPLPTGPATGDATVTVLHVNGDQERVGRTLLRVQEPVAPLGIGIAHHTQPGTVANPLGQTAVLTLTARDIRGIPVNSDLLVAISPEGDAPLAPIDPAALTRTPRVALPSLARTTAIAPRTAPRFERSPTGGGSSVRSVAPDDYRTGFWGGGLRSGPDGTLRLEVPLPAGVTRWRVSVVGSGGATLFGQASATITTTQPLIIQPMLPPALMVGDSATVELLARNTGDRTATLTATLTTAHLAVTQPPTQTVQVSAGANQRVSWQIMPTSATPGIVTFTLQSDATVTGTITGTIQVAPDRTEIEQQTVSGPLRFTRPITTSPEGQPLSLSIAFAPTYKAAIAQSQAWLDFQERRSIEQEASLLALSAFLQQTEGISATADWDATIDRSEATLSALQQPGGGWGWWPGTLANAFMTGYVLEMFTYADSDGRGLPPAARERALAYLEQQVDLITDSDLQAYLLYVLSLYDQDQTVAARNLLQTRSARPLEADGLAYLALLLPPEDARIALDRLAALSQRRQVPLETAEEVFWNVDTEGGLPRSAVSITALVVRALERGQPDSPLLAPARRMLAHGWGVDGWPTAYDSARAADALRQVEAAQLNATTAPSATVTLHSQRYLLATDTLTSALRLDLQLPDRNGTLGIEINGDGDNGLPLLAYRLTRSDAVAASGDMQDVALTRDYYDPVSGETLDPADLRRGQLVGVHLTVVVARTQSFITINEPHTGALLPLSTTPAAPFEQITADQDALRWSASRLGPGVYRQSYLARVGVSGDYLAPPASFTSAYRINEAARGPAQRIVVR